MLLICEVKNKTQGLEQWLSGQEHLLLKHEDHLASVACSRVYLKVPAIREQMQRKKDRWALLASSIDPGSWRDTGLKGMKQRVSGHYMPFSVLCTHEHQRNTHTHACLHACACAHTHTNTCPWKHGKTVQKFTQEKLKFNLRTFPLPEVPIITSVL